MQVIMVDQNGAPFGGGASPRPPSGYQGGGGGFMGGGQYYAQPMTGSHESVAPPTILTALTFLCCLCPGGICACFSLLKCTECNAAIAQRDFETARRKRDEAMKWIYAAWIGSAIFMLFYYRTS